MSIDHEQVRDAIHWLGQAVLRFIPAAAVAIVTTCRGRKTMNNQETTTAKAKAAAAMATIAAAIVAAVFGEPIDWAQFEAALRSLAEIGIAAIVAGAAGYVATWRIPNKPKDSSQ